MIIDEAVLLDVLKLELGDLGEDILETLFEEKDGVEVEGHLEEFEDFIHERAKKERGVEKAENVVDRLKKMRLLDRLGKLEKKPKSKVRSRNKYETLKELGEVCMNLNQLEEAENHFEKLMDFSEELDRREMIAKSLIPQAELFLLLDDLQGTEENAKKILSLGESIEEEKLIGEGMRLAGIVAWRRGETGEGMRYLKEALNRFKELGLKDKSAAVNRELGDLRANEDDLDKAIEHYRESAELFGKADMAFERVNMLQEIGMILSDMDRIDEAIEYFETAEKVCEKNYFIIYQAWSLFNLGELYLEKGRRKKGEKNLKKAIELFKNSRDQHGEAGSKMTFARFLKEKGELSEAERKAGSALDLFAELEMTRSRAEALRLLSEIHEKEERFEEAVEELEEAMRTYDSLDMIDIKEKIESELEDLTKHLK